MKNQVEAPNKYKRWSEAEDQEIINFDHVKYTDKWLAKKLNRTKRAIDGRRYQLRNAGFEIFGQKKTTAKRDYFTL